MNLTLRLPSGPREFHCRDGTSDINVANQAFRDGAFELSKLKRAWEIKRWLDQQDDAPLIIDAGANCGSASVWFTSIYPKARILALEPEHSNYNALCDNTADLLNIFPLQAALGSSHGYVSVRHPSGGPVPGMGHAAFRTYPVQGDTGDARIHTMTDLLGMAPDWTPFIAKIDIEGAESDVFSGDTSWIDKFPVLIVELHDWLYPKQRMAQSFLKAVAPLDRDFVLHGEHVVSIRNDL